MEKENYRLKANYAGVYFRKSVERTFKGKADVCYDIVYKREGRKIWEKVGWASEGYSAKLASQVRAERVRMIRHHQELPRDKEAVPRFSDVAKLYLDWAKENKCRDRDDRGRYENHLKNPLGNKRLNEISSFDLERLKSELTKKDLAPATVKHCMVLVREMFNKAIEWGKYKGANPVRGVKLPVLNNKRERFLTHEEADILLQELGKVSRSVHDQALLALFCGLRFGEIVNLRATDIDFQNGLIRIADPKNRTSRAANMPDGIAKMLKTRLPEDPNDLIFKDRWHGESVKHVSKTFDRVVESLDFNKGIKDLRKRVVFHTLRHTFASWLAIQGTPILTIKELLGHRTLAMTERYAHLIPDVKKEAALALEANFQASRNIKPHLHGLENRNSGPTR